MGMSHRLLAIASLVTLLASAGCEDDAASYVPRYFDGGPVTHDGGVAFVHLCGDGTVQAELGEECDDANETDEDGCSSFCQREFCGDGVVQAGLGESCDDQNMVLEDGCAPTCDAEFCGDGVVQVGLGEECDDGNMTALDGCSDICESEGTVESVQVTVNCVNPLDISALDFVVDIDLTLVGTPTTGGGFVVLTEATMTTDVPFAQLLVDLSAPDPATVDLLQFSVDLDVSGTTAGTLPLAGVGLPLVLDADPDGNGVGEPMVMLAANPLTMFTNDGSATIDFALSSFSFELDGVPLLGALEVNAPSLPTDAVTCTIPPHTLLSVNVL